MNTKLDFDEIINRLKAAFGDDEDGVSNFAHSDINTSDEYNEEEIKAQEVQEAHYATWKHLPNTDPERIALYEEYRKLPSQYSLRRDRFWRELDLGEVVNIETEGGEGEGEHWHSVQYFKDHDIYIKVTGHYTSYNGTEFYDGWDCCKEVRPVEKLVTFYE